MRGVGSQTFDRLRANGENRMVVTTISSVPAKRVGSTLLDSSNNGSRKNIVQRLEKPGIPKTIAQLFRRGGNRALPREQYVGHLAERRA
jgi:hypothetical protein